MPYPPLAVTNAALARLIWNVGGELAVNVLGMLITGAPTFSQALANTLDTAIKGAFTTHLQGRMAPTTEYLGTGIRDIRAPRLPEFVSTNAPVVGAGTGDPLPSQIALCTTVRTALAGKSARGRLYMSGWDELQNDAAGQASAATVAAMIAFWQALTPALSTSGFSPAVISRPALAFVDTRTWTLANGATQVDTIGRGSARTGGALQASAFESRNADWETIRSRNNGRGTAAIGALTSKVSVPINP